LLKGTWIANEYYKDDRSEKAVIDGWFHTGDVVTLDTEGTMKIVDRTGDLIKSSREWISSVELENDMMSHEDVYEGCVIVITEEKWGVRPVACVVLHEHAKGKVNEANILDFLEPQFAKFWIQDQILFIDEIPKSSVGKFLKRKLRTLVYEQLDIKI